MIAALGDFSFDFFGYSMALTSVFFQVGYDVFVYPLVYLLASHCMLW